MSTWWEESVYKNPEIYLKVVDRDIGDKVEDKQQKWKDSYEKAIGNGTCPLISPEMYSSNRSYSEKAFLDSGMLFKN